MNEFKYIAKDGVTGSVWLYTMMPTRFITRAKQVVWKNNYTDEKFILAKQKDFPKINFKYLDPGRCYRLENGKAKPVIGFQTQMI